MKAHHIKLHHRFVDAFPADPEEGNFRRQVIGAAYSLVKPLLSSAPQLVAVSEDMAHELGLDMAENTPENWASFFAGNALPADSKPYAACYGGHQFGHWAGQLGDGRAINLGEIETQKGLLTLQLKGAGPTPYARNADGFAVLRSSVREFLCSEAMYYLGIPTTRALALVTSGDQVLRDILYNGNAAYEPGAIVCRVAPDFIRFGNFEIFAARQDHHLLKLMADYTLRHHYPHLGSPSPETYLTFFREVADKTLDMVIHWLRVGFVHGVMNTDNMSILGLTIDYGPYGWLEAYRDDWTPNTTDKEGRRYAFGQQANISLWNLWKLGNALYPLIGSVEGLQAILEAYPEQYRKRYVAMMLNKLGLYKSLPDDGQQIKILLDLMERDAIDYNLFFRFLSEWDVQNQHPEFWPRLLKRTSYQALEGWPETDNGWQLWVSWYNQRLLAENEQFEQRKSRMDAVNPAFIIRNYMAHEAIGQAEKGNYSLIHQFMKLLKEPYAITPVNEVWLKKSPDWAFETPGCSMLSCSS